MGVRSWEASLYAIGATDEAQMSRDKWRDLAIDAATSCVEIKEANDRLLALINQHANDCVKCGDCGFWQQFERPLENVE